MEIKADDWEQQIDEVILSRGYEYFRTGQIRELKRVSPSVFKAVVEGSEDYSVRVSLENDVLTSLFCDCPYEWGPVCKHVAAVLYALFTDGAAQKPEPEENKPERIEALLKDISDGELRDFIVRQSREDAAFQSAFLLYFAARDGRETKEQYVKRIQIILKSAADRHGFIDYSSGRQVYNKISRILDGAEKQRDAGNLRTPFLVSTAVMEELADSFEYADDSSGNIGGGVSRALELFMSLADCEPDEILRQEIFDYGLETVGKGTFRGWDWHTDILKFAAGMARNQADAGQIFSLMEQDGFSAYEREYCQMLRYDLLLRFCGETAANQYLTENLKNPGLRRLALEAAMKSGDFNKTAELARQGVETDQNKWPGLVSEWHDWLLRAALGLGNREQIILYARQLFLDDFRKDQDYYGLLKEYTEAGEWKSFLEDMIGELRSEKKWKRQSREMTAKIYINEKWWDRLLALVKEEPSLPNLDLYYEYLKKEYPAELAGLYGQAVLTYMTNSTGRGHYIKVCGYLAKIKSLGQAEPAETIALNLRKIYPRRRALLEELGAAGF